MSQMPHVRITWGALKQKKILVPRWLSRPIKSEYGWWEWGEARHQYIFFSDPQEIPIGSQVWEPPVYPLCVFRTAGPDL